MVKRQTSIICPLNNSRCGFTLVELLVVVAIIALLVGLLLPALAKARIISKRLACQTNLKEIAAAWHLYLGDNDEKFYKGINVNHDYGGWTGTGGFAPYRPLNKYVGLPAIYTAEGGTELFLCPADRGGIFGVPSQISAYNYFGNSYQTNIFLVGPTRIGGPGNLKALHDAASEKLARLKLSGVTNNHSLVLLVGDNNWMTQWDPFKMPHSKDWHGKERCHNLAFLDGHVKLLKIRKGLYVTGEYHILPFRNLNHMATSVQKEVE